MRKFILLLAATVLTLAAANAATVTSVPGGLSQVVTNDNETSLTVDGSIDARDFLFITERLKSLQTLNLENATIAAYESDHALFGNQVTYAANAVPAMALAGHKALQQVTLPATATVLGTSALAGCTALTTVNMGAALTDIDDLAFAGCERLVTVTLPANVQNVGKGAFRRCTALTTVQVADGGSGMLRLGDEVLMGCTALTTVAFGNRLAAIGARAFVGSGIKSLDLTGYGALRQVGDYAFVATQLSTVKFPSSVTRLGQGAFLYAPVASVTMPRNLSTIAPYAFAGTKQLSTLDLSKTDLDTIADYAFFGASRLASVTLPATTAYIGTRAMAGMTGLTEIRSKAEAVPALGETVWQYLTPADITLYVPNAAVDDYKAAEQWKEFNVLKAYLRGDANNDGAVDIGDVNAIINKMLNKPSEEEFFFEAADTDSNGHIDIDDVNFVINVILKRIDPSAAPRVTDTDDLVTIDDFAIEAGQTRTIAVKLSHTARYTAMQCDIVLPCGLTLTDDGISATSSSAGHLLASATDDGNVRIVCYALDGRNFGVDDDVATLNVKATDNMSGEAVIAVENVVLGTAASTVHHCDDSYARVSTTTAVDDINAATCNVRVDNGVLIIESSEAAQAQLVAMNGVSTTLAVMGGHNEYTGIEPGFYVVRINATSHKVVIR